MGTALPPDGGREGGVLGFGSIRLPAACRAGRAVARFLGRCPQGTPILDIMDSIPSMVCAAFGLYNDFESVQCTAI